MPADSGQGVEWQVVVVERERAAAPHALVVTKRER